MTVIRDIRVRRMLSLGVLLMGVAAAVLIQVSRVRAEPPTATPATAPATTLDALRQERIQTLRTAAEMTRQMYAQGLVDLGEVLRIDRSLLDAQLESATTDAARVEILKEALAIAKKQEELAAMRAGAGAGGPVATLEAKAERLRVEVRLAEIAEK